MSLMADNGEIREDLRVPDSEIGKEISSKFDGGDEFMVSVRSLVPLIPCRTLLTGLSLVSPGVCDLRHG